MKLNSTLSLLALFCFASQAAQYQVIELGLGDEGAQSFADHVNSSGDVYSRTTGYFNPPIDLSLLDFESETLKSGLTDIDAAMAGMFNAEDYTFLYSLIEAGQNNFFVQQLGSSKVFISNGSDNLHVAGLDQQAVNFSGLTHSVETEVRSSNQLGNLVGVSTDPFYTLTYTNEENTQIDYVLNDFSTRGFVQMGTEVMELVPEVNLLGGISIANDINNGLQVAGMESIQVNEVLQEAKDNCDNDEERGDVPIESCYRGLMLGTGFSNNFLQRGVIWQLDELGTVISKTQLGIMFLPEEDDDRFYSSLASSVNDNGIAVGTSQLREDNAITTQAVIFDSDQVIDFIDRDEYFSSTAVSINNNNLIAGHGSVVINGATRTKLYIHDYNSGETRFPQDFFQSSAAIARDINNRNQVVGDAEVEGTLVDNRRREGFLYDYNTDNFVNINALLVCDSPYRIVQANSINDAGQIAATALVIQPRRDITGEVVLDENGQEIQEEVPIAVRLDPIDGEIDNCEEEEVLLERQGASLHSMFMLLLGWILVFRNIKLHINMADK
jgi:hypothetical protein